MTTSVEISFSVSLFLIVGLSQVTSTNEAVGEFGKNLMQVQTASF